MLDWVLSIVCFVRPSISYICLRVSVKIKNFNHTFPYRLSVENFFHWYAFAVRRFDPMQPSDYLFQFLDIGHAVASSKSPTLQNVPVTPAAIAGVHLRVLCRLTKL